MRKINLILLVLLVLSILLLGSCSGTVDNPKRDVPLPPSLPEDVEEVPLDNNNLQPPSLPEE